MHDAGTREMRVANSSTATCTHLTAAKHSRFVERWNWRLSLEKKRKRENEESERMYVRVEAK